MRQQQFTQQPSTTPTPFSFQAQPQPQQQSMDASATNRRTSASGTSANPASTEFTARRAMISRASHILREAAATISGGARITATAGTNTQQTGAAATRAMTLSQYEQALQQYIANNPSDVSTAQRVLQQRQSPVVLSTQNGTSAGSISAFQEYIQQPQAYPPRPSNPQSRAASSSTTRGVNGGAAAAARLFATNMGMGSPNMHPSFRSKTVCQLSCRFCTQDICRRGMKAILLADTRVELYSTDTVPAGRVQLVADDYLTRNCNCRIRDVACLGCGNVIGYHVTQPCDVCMGACNNGHFWMFHDDAIQSSERLDPVCKKTLTWSQIPFAEKDVCEQVREPVCR